ncbi:unnamed protein product [Linum tenue]|uniref:Gnk2-homologous domain-containing protein n=1 Tax=Linum tenue TaxID=586396 RepID=A0AAV0RBJ5_9ROSI|nr:unnamed protein product [Linum tenue]
MGRTTTTSSSSSSSSILVVVAALLFIIFSDGSSTAVAESPPNTDKVASGCGPLVDHRPETRAQALRSINHAIEQAATAARRNTSWASGPSSKVVAFANCSVALTAAGCKKCLNEAQFRVINVECPYVFGGWIELVDCNVRVTSLYVEDQR